MQKYSGNCAVVKPTNIMSSYYFKKGEIHERLFRFGLENKNKWKGGQEERRTRRKEDKRKGDYHLLERLLSFGD